MEAIRQGPAHPIAITALVTLLLNDHVIRVHWPSVVTGKLSDVAWLVVAAVVVASLLARLGNGKDVARWGAVAGVGGVFTLLQVWAPLGDTWVALTGGRHVADLEDLWCLPALLLAPLCWRGVPRPKARTALLLPVASFACLATSYITCEPTRLPVDGELAWDPTRPLGLGLGLFGVAPHDTAGVLRAITLTTADGVAVDVVATTAGQTTWLCPIGGLLPGTDYLWTVDAMETSSPNHVAPSQAVVGTTTFRTAAIGEFDAATTERGCEQLVADLRAGLLCGDTGFAYYGDTAVDAGGDTGQDPP